jgi:adenylosuccinate lyase
MSTIIKYCDPTEGTSGWLVYDGLACRLAVGGCRAQHGLTADTLAMLASRMRLKERVLGINVDGAKCGLAISPHAPAKRAALGRFLAFLRAELTSRLSLGCDMGTSWEELEDLARGQGIPSVKYAIRRAQGLSEEDFFARLHSLDEPVGPLTLAQRRAGHALAETAITAARSALLSAPVTCSLQGFGTLGRGAACTLADNGIRVIAVADEYGCVADSHGLDVMRMLGQPPGAPVTAMAAGQHLPSSALFSLPTDLIVLAAHEDAVTAEQAAGLQAPVVVVGANCGLSLPVERLLCEAGVLVMPDFIGGIGGSASMEALFGADWRPDPAGVLADVTHLMRQLVGDLITQARRQGRSPREVACDLAAAAVPDPTARPYGGSPYLQSGRPSRPERTFVTTERTSTVTDSPASPSANCRHERGHITDSRFYGDRYATPASRRIFCDDCRNQRWLDIEVALAQTQAELGIIPDWAAKAITSAAVIGNIDLEAVREEINRSGHSLVGLLRVLQAACPDGAGEYIHFGATTQDIQDTGQVLEIRDVLDELDTVLRAVGSRLAELAEEHAETIALGRTHARPALPMSFGLKVASWLDELQRDAQRLTDMRPRVLVAQLFGGAGTMAGFGGLGEQVLAGFAKCLGLEVPCIGWHVARDRIVEYVADLATVAGTMGRMADEIRTIGRPEFGEISEDWRHGKIGSSTMPHKRNPERAEQVVVMAKLAAAQAGIALTGMIGDHERDSRALRVEWACVPDVSHYCLAACEIMRELVTGLSVHPQRLWENVREVADEISSERLMLALGRHLGKQTAHERVYELSQAAHDCGRPIRDLLAECDDLRDLLSKEDLDTVFDPAEYLGESAILTRRAVAATRSWLEQP